MESIKCQLTENPPEKQSMPTNILVVSKENGEGNGNPLQYSCLENPMDGGAW